MNVITHPPMKLMDSPLLLVTLLTILQPRPAPLQAAPQVETAVPTCQEMTPSTTTWTTLMIFACLNSPTDNEFECKPTGMPTVHSSPILQVQHQPLPLQPLLLQPLLLQHLLPQHLLPQHLLRALLPPQTGLIALVTAVSGMWTMAALTQQNMLLVVCRPSKHVASVVVDLPVAHPILLGPHQRRQRPHLLPQHLLPQHLLRALLLHQTGRMSWVMAVGGM